MMWGATSRSCVHRSATKWSARRRTVRGSPNGLGSSRTMRRFYPRAPPRIGSVHKRPHTVRNGPQTGQPRGWGVCVHPESSNASLLHPPRGFRLAPSLSRNQLTNTEAHMTEQRRTRWTLSNHACCFRPMSDPVDRAMRLSVLACRALDGAADGLRQGRDVRASDVASALRSEAGRLEILIAEQVVPLE